MKKRLERSRDNVLVAGVCSGFAEYFDHDPVLWRLGFVFFLVVTGLMPGILMYLIAWIVMPVRAEVREETHNDTVV